MNVRDEIRLHAKAEDKPALNWLFGRYHWASQWGFVAKCEHVRYGVESYKTYRVWSPTVEGVAIYKQLSGAKCPECDGRGEVETGIGMLICDKCRGDGV
jgi:hypothetical protein